MAKVKIDISRMDVPRKIQKSREIVLKMTGNKAFANPNPSLAILTIANNDLEIAFEAAADGGHSLVKTMHIKEKQLDAFIVQLAAYVENITGGDEQKILSSGFDVRDVPIHGKQTDSVVAGTHPGEVIAKAMLDPTVKNVLHDWQYAYDYLPTEKADSNSWIGLESTSKATITIKNLTSGSKVWVRHLAVLNKGQKTAWHVIGSVTVP